MPWDVERSAADYGERTTCAAKKLLSQWSQWTIKQRYVTVANAPKRGSSLLAGFGATERFGGNAMGRKDLIKMIALATGISVAGGEPIGAADLHPELGTDDPLIFEPAAGPGPGPGGGGFSEGY